MQTAGANARHIKSGGRACQAKAAHQQLIGDNSYFGRTDWSPTRAAGRRKSPACCRSRGSARASRDRRRRAGHSTPVGFGEPVAQRLGVLAGGRSLRYRSAGMRWLLQRRAIRGARWRGRRGLGRRRCGRGRRLRAATTGSAISTQVRASGRLIFMRGKRRRRADVPKA